jgi:hypothetical protein
MQEESPRTNRFSAELVVPHSNELAAAYARLIRLAECFGIRCGPLRLEKQVQQRAAFP